MPDNQISVQNFIDRLTFHSFMNWDNAHDPEKMAAFDAAHTFSWMDNFLWEAWKRDFFQVTITDGSQHEFNLPSDWQYRETDPETFIAFLQERLNGIIKIEGATIGGRSMIAEKQGNGSWKTTIERRSATMPLTHLAQLPWIDPWDDESSEIARIAEAMYRQQSLMNILSAARHLAEMTGKSITCVYGVHSLEVKEDGNIVVSLQFLQDAEETEGYTVRYRLTEEHAIYGWRDIEGVNFDPIHWQSDGFIYTQSFCNDLLSRMDSQVKLIDELADQCKTASEEISALWNERHQDEQQRMNHHGRLYPSRGPRGERIPRRAGPVTQA